MTSKMIHRSLYGIAYGAIITFIALTFLMKYNINPPVSQLWLYMLASLILGIYFGLASCIFDIEFWSPLKKTIIHYCLSIMVYFLIAIPFGWISFTLLAIFLWIIFFTIIYALFWFGYALYYKRIESSMNDTLHKNK